jgi:hypothetical protein
MKKSIVALSLIAFAGLMLLTGCQTASSPASTSIPTAAAASSIGLLAKDGLSIDNSVMGIFSYAQSAGAPRANAPTSITYGSDGWWSAVNTYSMDEGGVTYSFDYNYKFKVWNRAGVEITTAADLDTMDDTTVGKLWMAVTFTYGSGGTTGSYTFGTSTASPMKIEGYGTSGQTIDGTITYSSKYNTESYETSITYNTLSMSTSGYPSGSVTWNLKTNGSTVYSGSITYDGTNIAICTFSSGASGSYSVNLDTGAVTAI